MCAWKPARNAYGVRCAVLEPRPRTQQCVGAIPRCDAHGAVSSRVAHAQRLVSVGSATSGVADGARSHGERAAATPTEWRAPNEAPGVASHVPSRKETPDEWPKQRLAHDVLQPVAQPLEHAHTSLSTPAAGSARLPHGGGVHAPGVRKRGPGPLATHAATSACSTACGRARGAHAHAGVPTSLATHAAALRCCAVRPVCGAAAAHVSCTPAHATRVAQPAPTGRGDGGAACACGVTSRARHRACGCGHATRAGRAWQPGR